LTIIKGFHVTRYEGNVFYTIMDLHDKLFEKF